MRQSGLHDELRTAGRSGVGLPLHCHPSPDQPHGPPRTRRHEYSRSLPGSRRLGAGHSWGWSRDGLAMRVIRCCVLGSLARGSRWGVLLEERLRGHHRAAQARTLSNSRRQPRSRTRPVGSRTGAWLRLDFVDPQNQKIRRPTMRFKQRIMIGTEVSRCLPTADSAVEHAAEAGAIDCATVYAESDETSRELVHDHERPVASKHDGLAPKEVDAPGYRSCLR